MLTEREVLAEQTVRRAIASGQFCTVRISPAYFTLKVADQKTVRFNVLQDFKTLSLIAKVKSDALYYLDREQEKVEYNDAPRYFEFDRQTLQGVVGHRTKGYKIDITGAYWIAAHNRFLTGETYELGKANKPARLKALGALAKKTLQLDFADGKLLDRIETRPKTNALYQAVAKEVDDAVYELNRHMAYSLGYWVDCIIVRGHDAQRVKRIVADFARMGYPVKSEPVTLETKVQDGWIYLVAKGAEEKAYFTGLAKTA